MLFNNIINEGDEEMIFNVDNDDKDNLTKPLIYLRSKNRLTLLLHYENYENNK